MTCDPLYEVHECIFSKLSLNDKRVYSQLCRNTSEIFQRNTYNIKTIVHQIWSQLNITSLYVTPYTISTKFRDYKYLAIYAEVNNIPLAIKLLDTHIFVCYIPTCDVEKVKRHISTGTNMKEFDDYYTYTLTNIVSDRPYCKLGALYLERVSKTFHVSIKQSPFSLLTSLDVFSLLFKYWQFYYSPSMSLFHYLINDYNKYTDEVSQHTLSVSIYTNPYHYIYMDFKEFIHSQYLASE